MRPESTIPSYATGVQRIAGRITGLTLRARRSTPSSRPSKAKSSVVTTSVYADNGAVTIRADGMSMLTFEPGALQSALADLEGGQI